MSTATIASWMTFVAIGAGSTAAAYQDGTCSDAGTCAPTPVAGNLPFRYLAAGVFREIFVRVDPLDEEVTNVWVVEDGGRIRASTNGGADWTYTFLKSFYVDEGRPSGWNNTLLPNASMPNVLWELQGTQRAVHGEHAAGGVAHIEKLELASPGQLDPEQFDRSVRDLTAFLQYVGEPSALQREATGLWVILFLAAFTLLAWVLKKQYWKDVH